MSPEKALLLYLVTLIVTAVLLFIGVCILLAVAEFIATIWEEHRR